MPRYSASGGDPWRSTSTASPPSARPASSKPRLIRRLRTTRSSLDFGGETNSRKLRFRAHICRFARRTKYRVCTVEGYRLYRLDGVAKVASAEWIDADDDQAAIAAAKEMMDGHGWELWNRTRLVIRIDPAKRR